MYLVCRTYSRYLGIYIYHFVSFCIFELADSLSYMLLLFLLLHAPQSDSDTYIWDLIRFEYLLVLSCLVSSKYLCI